jgi:hypothetical protein
MPSNDTDDAYFVVGPFATDIDACAWGEEQIDIHPMWCVLELETPGAEPRVLPPTIRTFASGHVENIIPPAPGERGFYIFCWTGGQHHLIGPFGDGDQCMQFANCNSDEGGFEGPYDRPEWCVLLLCVPPPSPRVVSSGRPALPAEEVRRRRLKDAEDDAFIRSLRASAGFDRRREGTILKFR